MWNPCSLGRNWNSRSPLSPWSTWHLGTGDEEGLLLAGTGEVNRLLLGGCLFLDTYQRS
jgi:hypothetical protein